MYILYLAKLKERGLFWKEQGRMVQGEVVTQIALSFLGEQKIFSFCEV